MIIFGIIYLTNSVLKVVLSLILFGLSFFLFDLTHYNVQNMCKNNAISYELVETIAQATGECEHDIAYFLKYAAGAEMDLYDAVSIIDPDLSNEEVTAIVKMSDLRQKGDN
jgi:hypothetical protein